MILFSFLAQVLMTYAYFSEMRGQQRITWLSIYFVLAIINALYVIVPRI